MPNIKRRPILIISSEILTFDLFKEPLKKKTRGQGSSQFVSRNTDSKNFLRKIFSKILKMIDLLVKKIPHSALSSISL